MTNALGPESRRLPSLTGLRWLAAFAVFGFHLRVHSLFRDGIGANVLSYLFAAGAVGVGFFFILSGFVLTWSSRPGDGTKDFWRRRFARVYPNHVVTWALVLAGLIATGRSVGLWEIGLNFALLQAWVPDQSIFFGMNTPSWSLSCEALFYLTFPALWAGLRGCSAQTLTVVLRLVVVGIFAVPTLALSMPDYLGYWFTFVFPLSRLFEFALGIISAKMLADGLWPQIEFRQASGLLLGTYLLAPHVGGYGYGALTALPVAALLVASARRDLSGAPSLWSRPLVVRLGEWSFAFYLLHQLVIRFAAPAHQDLVRGTLWAAVTLLVALAAAALLHRTIELPVNTRLRSIRPHSVAPRRGDSDNAH